MTWFVTAALPERELRPPCPLLPLNPGPDPGQGSGLRATAQGPSAGVKRPFLSQHFETSSVTSDAGLLVTPGELSQLSFQCLKRKPKSFPFLRVSIPEAASSPWQ